VQKFWQWLAANPGYGVVVIVSTVVGLLSILKDIAKGCHIPLRTES
jgi:hypothetical protein